MSEPLSRRRPAGAGSAARPFSSASHYARSASHSQPKHSPMCCVAQVAQALLLLAARAEPPQAALKGTKHVIKTR